MKSKKLSPLAVYLVCAAAIVLLLAADQYTKSLAVQYLKDQPSIELIPGVLELFYLENRGMAFGLLQDQYWLFAMMTVLFLIVMVIVFYKLPKTRRFYRFCRADCSDGWCGRKFLRSFSESLCR